MPSAAHYEADNVQIDKVVVGPHDNNVYIVLCTRTGESVLIDAANEADRLVELAREAGVRRVLTTHGHWDHVQAVGAMRTAGIPVGVGAAVAAEEPEPRIVIDAGEVIEVGAIPLRAVHTPRHTPGGMSFVLEGHPVLFSGDTLFPGGPGNTSLAGGDFETVIASIRDRLYTLPDDTLVFPGHGLDTTIGTERPHLQEWIDRGW